MDINVIHEHARRLVNAHGDKAELEAARKAAECERQGEKRQAVDWRRIQAAMIGFDRWRRGMPEATRDAADVVSGPGIARRGCSQRGPAR